MHLPLDQDPTAAPGQPGPDGQEEAGGAGDQTGETQEKETNQLAVLGVEVMGGAILEGATTTGAGWTKRWKGNLELFSPRQIPQPQPSR